MSYLKNFEWKIVGPETAPRVVFLHGLMGFLANWQKITTLLQPDYQVLAFDQRGHGRSFQPTTGYAPEDYADDLNLILEELGWTDINLVGHSMGGRNVLNFTSRFPQKVKRLVIEDIGPEPNPAAAQKIQNLLNRIPTPFKNRAEAKIFFLNDFVREFTEWKDSPTLGQYLYANISEGEHGFADWRFSKNGIFESLEEGLHRDRWDEVKGLQTPTLVIRGEHSSDLSRETLNQMAAINPMIQTLEIDDAGHWVHFDQPHLFTQALRAFFAS